MIDKKLKRKWVAALRGGTWTQIRGEYRIGGTGRCALGVLAETIRPGGPPTLVLGDLDTISGEQWCHITYMNDCEKASFNEIADWIEENL